MNDLAQTTLSNPVDVIFSLKFPIAGLDRVTMRRPTVADMEEFGRGALDAGRILERLTGLQPDVIRALIYSDAEPIFVALAEMVPAIDGGIARAERKAKDRDADRKLFDMVRHERQRMSPAAVAGLLEGMGRRA